VDSIGNELRHMREVRGLSIQQVFESTRVFRTIVEAMEADDFSSFPSPVYATAFLKTYCRFLRIDFEPLIALLEPQQVIPELAIQPKGRLQIAVVSVLVAAVCLMVIGAAVVKFTMDNRVMGRGAVPVESELVGQKPTSPVISIPAGQPAVTIVSAEDEATTGVRIRLRIVQNAWLRVQSGNQTCFEGILKAGTVKEFRSSQPISVRTGNAGGVFVRPNQQPERLMGSEGRIAETVFQFPRQ